MRPIAKTSFAAILTLLALAFAIGQGPAMQQPLVIVLGLVVQLPLALIMMPALFGMLMRWLVKVAR